MHHIPFDEISMIADATPKPNESDDQFMQRELADTIVAETDDLLKEIASTTTTTVKATTAIEEQIESGFFNVNLVVFMAILAVLIFFVYNSQRK